MNSHETQDQIQGAMTRLKEIRDSLGATLASPSRPNRDENEMRRLSELHDRLANAISAYSRGA